MVLEARDCFLDGVEGLDFKDQEEEAVEVVEELRAGRVRGLGVAEGLGDGRVQLRVRVGGVGRV